MTTTTRILYLALADARGHLMRAHVLRGVLAGRGVEVDIVTTSDDGARFLAALGTPAAVLPGGFGMELGPRHDLRLGATRRRVLRYAMRELRRDVDALRARAAGCALVVNDSFHPALLGAHLFAPELFVVHVHGENLRETVRAQSRPLRVDRWLSHARQIVHALDDVPGVGARGELRLPPVIALPSSAPGAVRAALAPSARGLAAVYLNPHYRAPFIADLVEGAVADAGLALCGVSEVFAGRPGWRAADGAFVDVVAAAEVFVSGAGMGALEQARATGTPLVCLLGDQAEQTRNVAERGLPAVHLDDPGARARLARALASVRGTRRDADGRRENRARAGDVGRRDRLVHRGGRPCRHAPRPARSTTSARRRRARPRSAFTAPRW